MKTFCVAFISCLVVLMGLLIVPPVVSTSHIGGTSADTDATSEDFPEQRDLFSSPIDALPNARQRQLASMQYNSLVPASGTTTTNLTISARVLPSTAGATVSAVQLVYQPPGQSGYSKTKPNLKYTGGDNIWTIKMTDLPGFGFGQYKWYLVANDSKKAKLQTSVFTFLLTNAPPPPTAVPSRSPSVVPSLEPSRSPSNAPSAEPSKSPSMPPEPTQSPAPSRIPSGEPSLQPSTQPSEVPTDQPVEQVGPFSQISPKLGLVSEETAQTFSVKVQSPPGEVISEVKLWYKLQSDGQFKNNQKLKYKGGVDIWELDLTLSTGIYEWYLVAKTNKNTKVISTDYSARIFSFVIKGATYGLQENCFVQNLNQYDICLDLIGVRNNVIEPYMNAFIDARREWEKVITSHVMVWRGLGSYDIPVGTSVPYDLDDLYILGKEEVIDGKGGILGMAGPTLYGTFMDGRVLTATGVMIFDVADIQTLVKEGSWQDVIMHEMGHVLGIGVDYMWNGFESEAKDGFVYDGQHVLEKWSQYCSNDGSSLLVESGGGEGTRGSHWSEVCFGNELMTGWIAGKDNPLSVLTVAALEDLGYDVSYDAATDEVVKSSACCVPVKNSNRNLRGQENARELRPEKAPRSTPMSESLHYLAEGKAAQHLQAAREKAPASLPEGLVFVGGDFVNILAIEDGEIKEETFKWINVRHRLM